MRNNDIKRSFDSIKPDEADKQRMLEKVLQSEVNTSSWKIRDRMVRYKAIPAFMLAVVITVGIMAINQKPDNINDGRTGGDIGIGTDLTGREIGTDMALLRDQFQMGNRQYIILDDSLREEFGFPATLDKNHIGQKIGSVVTSVDNNLKGGNVYEYTPAGGEAVVVFEKDNEYKLFKFYTFDSYIRNQDEDTIAYLNLYGINKPEDIAKIQFLDYSNRSIVTNRPGVKAEITDTEEITRFYNYYSVIKNSSDKYFEKIYNVKEQYDKGEPEKNDVPNSLPDRLPPDYPSSSGSNSVEPQAQNYAGSRVPGSQITQPQVTDSQASDLLEYKGDILTDKAEIERSVPQDEAEIERSVPQDAGGATLYDNGQSGVTIQGSTGTADGAFRDSVTVRIYNNNGIYFDTVYYPYIGFISRHEVSDDFADFLSTYIK